MKKINMLLAATLLAQPFISSTVVFAEKLELPSVTKVKYPQEFQIALEDIQSKIDVLESVEDIFTQGQEVEYQEALVEVLQAMLDLDKFEDLGEIRELREVNDLFEMNFYRLQYILYELPKGIGHTYTIEFVRALRDSYFNTKYSLFEEVVYYFYRANEDPEISSDLLRFCYHIEEFKRLPIDMRPSWKPDEEQVVLPPGEVETGPDISAPLLPEDQMKEDLENAWDKELGITNSDKVQDSANSTKPSVYVPTTKPQTYVPTSTRVTYEYDEYGTCQREEVKSKGGTVLSKQSVKLTEKEAYLCGDVSVVDWSQEGMVSSEGEGYNRDFVYYLIGDGEWVKTMLRMSQNELEFKDVVALLRILVGDFNGFMVDDVDKYLFVINGKPLVIHDFEGVKSIEEINDLTYSAWQLQLAIDPHDEVEDSGEVVESEELSEDAQVSEVEIVDEAGVDIQE